MSVRSNKPGRSAEVRRTYERTCWFPKGVAPVGFETPLAPFLLFAAAAAAAAAVTATAVVAAAAAVAAAVAAAAAVTPVD